MDLQARAVKLPFHPGLATQPVDYKEYPRDLLDGLITPDNIYAIAPSDQYPAALRARAS